MKTWGIIGFAAIAICANAQWIPNGAPNVVDRQIITTGGITYSRVVGVLPAGSCCQRIAAYDVSRQDTNLFQTVERETWGGACVQTYCSSWQQEVVSVLGALPPGDYLLTLSAQSGPGFPTPWAFSTFTVPTNSTPTLTTTATNGPALCIQVAGVSSVLYVLEYSTNLVDWTAVATNHGAPATFSVATTNADCRFYRTSIVPSP